ncbi:MAG: heterodisulfide reductase-related iron-sulfur binding cluster [Planctomycetaceae bacterium]
MDPELTGPLMREIFGNVSPGAKLLFYCLSAAALAVFAWGIARRVRLWRRGKPAASGLAWKRAVGNLLRYALLQRRVRGRGLPSTAHLLLFGGFFVLFVGTVLIGVEHLLALVLGRDARHPVFHRGAYFAIYEVVLDTAGLSFLAGCILFALRRAKRPGSLAHESRDWLVLALFGAIGVTGYLLEGLRVIHEQTPLPGLSYVGYTVSLILQSTGITPEGAGWWHTVGWWLHAALSLGLIAWFPWCRLMHAIAGSVRLALGIDPLGVMTPVSLEKFEETGEMGVARLDQFLRRQLVELDACVSCGRCEDACPAFEAGKPLSPRDVVQDLLAHQNATAARDSTTTPERVLPGDVISAETLWSCTTCSACVDVCPLGVNPLGMIGEMRRYLVAEAQLHGPPAQALERTGRAGNPWGLSAQDRLAWAADLNVPTVADNPGFEVLYWVGCAATYDRRLQRVARSMVQLLRAAGINFAILGRQERCTGESARRMGDELLFQQLAAGNIEALEKSGVAQARKRIIAHCPHCVNSLRQDYSQLGAQLDVIHHTAYLAELVREGRLTVPAGHSAELLTYHDPCYLARVGGVTEEPRALLQAAVGRERLTEMPRHGRQTSCCGAGGGRMWFDDAVETRTGQSRVAEAQATGAKTLAVSCPFCLIMTSDGLAARGGGMAVKDIAEILAEALDSSRD